MVNISVTTARWMLETALRIFREGFNSRWHPSNPLSILEPEMEPGGFMDEIPLENSQMYAWASAMMTLCRALAGILYHALEVEREPLMDAFENIENIPD